MEQSSAAPAEPYPICGDRPVPAAVSVPPPKVHIQPPPPSAWRQLADFHSKDLNLSPTLALCIPMFIIFLGMSAFLEAYILSNASSYLGIFFVGSYIVFSTYFVSDHYMAKLSTSYASIPADKKFYVLSNLIKSAVLLAYSPSAMVTLYSACVNDDWSTPRIRAMGVLYAIPDAVSMLLVTRMATSTKIHHLCVVLFMVVNLCLDYEEETIGRALVVYGTFSTFAYLVNLLLASRFLPISPSVSLVLSTLALVIYASCLGVNWAWQVQFLYTLALSGPSALHTAAIAIYLALISLVVYDDVVLVKWLYKNVHKTAAIFTEAVRSPTTKKNR